MSGGSVRDRIKAAESLQGQDAAQSSASHRRGHRLSLKTDEHIKEEFLRRGDGGWHKKVDIGQQEKFIPRPDLPPVIKLTAETPVVSEPKKKLPGKLAKGKTATLESMSVQQQVQLPAADTIPQLVDLKTTVLPTVTVVETTDVESDWDRVHRLEAEQQAAMDAEAAATKPQQPTIPKEEPPASKDVAPEIPGAFVSAPDTSGSPHEKKEEDWDRVRRLEAEQQASMDAEAALSKAAVEEAAKDEHADWDRVRKMEAAQQAKMDADAALADEAADAFESARQKNGSGSPKARPKSKTKDVPIGLFESLLDDDPPKKSPKQASSRVRSHSKVEGVHSSHEVHTTRSTHARNSRGDLSDREQILFDPLEWEKKQQAKEARRAERKQSRTERLSVDVEHKSRARSPSIRLVRTEHSDEEDHGHREHREHRQHRERSEHHGQKSRSRSTHKNESEHTHSPPHSARRSTSSLWPSFSDSTRRSVSDVFEVSSHHQHPRHSRTASDAQSTTTTRSEMSPKNLEFVEYFAGKKVDHVSHASPPKSPPRPMGFVRSHSHTGEYTEGYTREKKLLRKPTDEDIFESDDHDHDHGHKNRRESRHHSHSHRKDTPWEIKLLQGIARS